MTGTDRPFPWGLWALAGFLGWIGVTVALGAPTLALAAPAAGVLCGWLIGAIVNLATKAMPRSRRRRSPSHTPSQRLSGNRAHWDRVYRDHSPQRLSWFEPEPRRSLQLIDSLALHPDEPIVDVGGGASRLVGSLAARGHTDLTVMDISDPALEQGRRQNPEAEAASWVVGDVRDHDFGRRFALWHDRAVFHFMVAQEDRDSYLATLERSLRPGGHIVLATFGPEAPAHCSGLPVRRYSVESLAEAFAALASVKEHSYEEHTTPGDRRDQYLYAHLIAHG